MEAGHMVTHDELVSDLERQLFTSHDYEKVLKFVEYCRNGQVGEVDILAMADGIYDMYEVKRTYHQQAKNKAFKQFERFKLAFPNRQINGYLYTSDRIIRFLG